MNPANIKLEKEFTFEAAHSLPHVAKDHKCRRLHGHSYRVTVRIEGPMDEKMGWLVDFADVKAALEPIRLQLDHFHLNEIKGLENPTAEILAIWIWERAKPVMPQLTRVTVAETCESSVIYEG